MRIIPAQLLHIYPMSTLDLRADIDSTLTFFLAVFSNILFLIIKAVPVFLVLLGLVASALKRPGTNAISSQIPTGRPLHLRL